MFRKIARCMFSALLMLNFRASGVNVTEMTLDEKLGQMIFLSFRRSNQNRENIYETQDASSLSYFTEINDDIKISISKYHIGGIVLFGQNFVNKEQSKQLVKDLQDAAKKSGNPPLIVAVDQEGGRVERFTFGRERLKNNSEVKTSEEAFQKGRIIAKELKEIGINCNLAPVVDINSNPDNPVINVRSFGNNADVVSLLGESFLKGLHSENIIATAKHFPGHGDTNVDSHFGLPVVNKNLNELEKLELKPFEKLSKNGVDMIMTAHISLPNIESKTAISKKTGEKIYLPATLSKTIISGILRNKIGFNGVVITDAMGMNAISENFGEDEASKMAINAGNDILCMPVNIESKKDIAKLDELFKYLKDAVTNGEIPDEQINASVTRTLKLKEKL